ncbi:hypothetical protein HDU98_000112 [Podochytrium sp. JEL0797]|nr:hypothetical protein HDU98_000112 [Podochytrium sp. JEL0797]
MGPKRRQNFSATQTTIVNEIARKHYERELTGGGSELAVVAADVESDFVRLGGEDNNKDNNNHHHAFNATVLADKVRREVKKLRTTTTAAAAITTTAAAKKQPTLSKKQPTLSAIETAVDQIIQMGLQKALREKPVKARTQNNHSAWWRRIVKYMTAMLAASVVTSSVVTSSSSSSSSSSDSSTLSLVDFLSCLRTCLAEATNPPPKVERLNATDRWGMILYLRSCFRSEAWRPFLLQLVSPDTHAQCATDTGPLAQILQECAVAKQERDANQAPSTEQQLCFDSLAETGVRTTVALRDRVRELMQGFCDRWDARKHIESGFCPDPETLEEARALLLLDFEFVSNHHGAPRRLEDCMMCWEKGCGAIDWVGGGDEASGGTHQRRCLDWVVPATPEDGNYFDLRARTVTLNVYKTSHIYGRYTYPPLQPDSLADKLIRIIYDVTNATEEPFVFFSIFPRTSTTVAYAKAQLIALFKVAGDLLVLGNDGGQYFTSITARKVFITLLANEPGNVLLDDAHVSRVARAMSTSVGEIQKKYFRIPTRGGERGNPLDTMYNPSK